MKKSAAIPHIPPDLALVFREMPGIFLLLAPDDPHYTILALSQDLIQIAGMDEEELIGQPLFKIFPGNPSNTVNDGRENLHQSFQYVLRHKTIHQLTSQRYDLKNEQGEFEERYWVAWNKPVLNKEGEVEYIIHGSREVSSFQQTEQLESKLKLHERHHRLFMQAPVGIMIIMGDHLTIELANQFAINTLQIKDDITGKPMPAILPNLFQSDLPALIEQVKNSGQSNFIYEKKIVLSHAKEPEEKYLNIALQPYFDDVSGDITGVICIMSDVTGQVMVHRDIENSEQKFQNLVTQASVATAVYVGREMKIQYANEAMIRLWGKDVSVIGSTVREALPELEGQPFHQLLDDVFTSGEMYWGQEDKGELVVDGKLQTFYFNYTYKPLRNVEGEIYGILNMAIDVTEQVLARKRVEASEHRFKNLIQENTIATALLEGKNMVLTLANDAMLKLWDRDKSIIGKPLLEFMPEIIDQPFPQILDHVYTTGEFHSQQDALVKLVRGGVLEDIYMDFSYKALHDNDGNINSILVMAIDVTEKVLAKKQLEESENNLRNMILQSPVAMCIFRGENHIVEIANNRMFELWGRPPEDILYKSIFKGLPEARNQGFEELLHKVYTKGVTVSVNENLTRLPRKGKIEEVYINFVYEPLREANDEITGVMAVALEVTEQVMARKKIEESEKELQERVKERTAELEKKNAELEQFAYIASHDLQEPLRKIRVFNDMLSRKKQQDAESMVYVDKIDSSARRMSDLIHNLLDYSRLTISSVQFERVNLEDVVKNILSDYEVLIQQKNALVTIEPLPEIEANPLQMNQLFYNLLGNALKFSSSQRQPEISIRHQQLSQKQVTAYPELLPQKKYVEITVSDNGIGFSQEYSTKIFTIFQRLNMQNLYGGYGIGLALCKKVVETHKGMIYAEGMIDKGANFHIILPLEQGS